MLLPLQLRAGLITYILTYHLKACMRYASIWLCRSFTILKMPPDRPASTVHGLGGDAVTTWTHPKSNAFWLKDFLPRQISDARIMTFGYNAKAAFGRSTAEILDHAKSLLASLVNEREDTEEMSRPLMFIAHSLGGIVVKQALLQARLEPRYHSIRDSTIGLLFLGTPHRGSDKATYGKVLANVAQFMTHRPPPQLLTALQTNSDVLSRLTTDFRFQIPEYQICSFFELIVEKQSALLETNHEEQIPVDADHSMICKFETDSDDVFKKIYKRIQRIRKSPQLKANEQSDSYNKHFEVPHLLSPLFTGHDDILQCLSHSMMLEQSSQGGCQRRFVLTGLGGSGKTQICLKYAQEYRERYWGIFWIDASSDDRIQQSFTRIARLLQIDEKIDSVPRRMANMSQTWLLIFDNADDPDLSLSPYLPAGSRGRIIITSRNPQCQHYNTVGFRKVGRLSLDDSISLFARMVLGVTNPSRLAAEGFTKVVEALGCLALAIVQAGAYIHETSCTAQDYLNVYHQHRRNILRALPKHIGTDYPYSVYATWQVSIDMIESKHNTLSEQTLRLVKLLGFYHYDQIPIHMFYNAWQHARADPRFLDCLPWQAPDSPDTDLVTYRQSIQQSISLLASFSLIMRNTDGSLSLHPLVHEWCRLRIHEDEQRLSYRRALSLLTGSVEWKFETTDYTFRRSLVSHVHKLFRHQKYQDELSEEEKMQEWPVLALILAENGWTRDAAKLTEQVVQLHKSKLGEDHPDTLGSMHNLAIQYSEAGRRTEALQLIEQVMQLRKSKLGEDHPDTLRSMHNLAIRYSEAGRRTEALQLTEQVVQLRKSKLGEDHPDTLRSMHNLAIQYSEAGRRTEALQLTEQVVQLRKSKLGEDHPDTLGSTDLLARL